MRKSYFTSSGSFQVAGKLVKNHLLLLAFSLCSLQAVSQGPEKIGRIDSLLKALYQQGQFNGSILIAQKGKILYKNAFGEANFTTHQPFTPSTVSCIASLSKPFTAMTILMLAERNQLNYDDPISRYLPELSGLEGIITIRHLLTHTSGIPDVGDLGIDNASLTNEKVLETVKNFRGAFRKPGLKYEYSNTGYVLLSMITERVSGKPFTDFITENIFGPLGMRHSFLYNGARPKPENVAVAYNSFGALSDYVGLTTGMGGIYSNVEDLLEWDKALYTGKLVHQATLDSAFTPYPTRQGSSTYGFGWNAVVKDGHPFVWHTGNTGSFRAILGREPDDQITVIILTNRGNSKRMEITEAVLNILHGKSYIYPKMPLAEKLYSEINRVGFDSATAFYRKIKANHDNTYDFSESELNALGYQLLGQNETTHAITVFELNTVAYSSSSNAFDSLAEAYYKAGNKELAVKMYQKALELNPDNLSSKKMLQQLQQ